MTNFETIEISVEAGVGHLVLAREARLNAMNPQFFDELGVGISELSAAADVRVIVLSAKGPHFSVGLDLKESVIKDTNGSIASQALTTYNHVRELQRPFNLLASVPQPTIAVVHGYCIGGGVDLIAACDIRVASADAVFSIRESRIAIVADLGSLQRLPRIISRGHLMELALTAEDFDAVRAHQINLVNTVYADQVEAMSGAIKIAGAIAANSPLSTMGTKNTLNSVYDAEISRDLDRVALWNSAFLRSNDLTEAMNAFVEKRDPNFRGN